jgi:DNA-binding protein H-NS
LRLPRLACHARDRRQEEHPAQGDTKISLAQEPENPVVGRGVTPVWMREEMKGTKLKKDDFLIAKA